MNRQEELNRVCESRGLPAIKVGDSCEVEGRPGVIVGSNASANLSVIFDDDNHASNCHPGYKMRIFNGMGGVKYESDDLYA